MSIPTLVLTGTREEMGHIHGETFCSEINDLTTSRSDRLFSEFPALKSEQLYESCLNGIRAVEKYTPLIYQEVLATAEAANLPVWKMLICGGFTDLLDVFNQAFASGAKNLYSECTTLIQPVERTICGTWDSTLEAQENSVVLIRRPKDNGLSIVSLTTAGWPAQQGVNSHGVGFGINNLSSKSAETNGLNYIAANAALSESPSVGHFLDFARSITFSAGHAYSIVDQYGAAAVIETSGARVSIKELDSSFVQTNHYSADSGIEDNQSERDLEDSTNRMNEMRTLSTSLITEKNISSHLAASSCINKKLNAADIMTCAFYVADAAGRKFSVARGASTGQDMQKFYLSRHA